MIQEGIIRFEPVTIDYCKQDPTGPFAIANPDKIVSITAYDEENSVVKVSHEGKEPVTIALRLSAFLNGPLFYPVVEEIFGAGAIAFGQSHSIKLDLWQFIIDKNLQNVKIEFDNSETEVSKITLFNPPAVPAFTTVFRVTVIPLISFTYDPIADYLNKEYLSYEEAQAILPEISKKVPYHHGMQVYFQIEKCFKRKEYEKETYS